MFSLISYIFGEKKILNYVCTNKLIFNITGILDTCNVPLNEEIWHTKKFSSVGAIAPHR